MIIWQYLFSECIIGIQAQSSAEPAAVSSSAVTGGKRSSKGKAVEEKPAKRMRTDSGRATYAQPTPTKSKGKVQVCVCGIKTFFVKWVRNLLSGVFETVLKLVIFCLVVW